MTWTVRCKKHVFGLSAPRDQSEQANGAMSTDSGLESVLERMAVVAQAEGDGTNTIRALTY